MSHRIVRHSHVAQHVPTPYFIPMILLLLGGVVMLSGCDDYFEPSYWLSDSNDTPPQQVPQDIVNFEEDEDEEEEEDGSALDRVLAREGGVLQMQVGANSMLPANFPTDIPLPDGMTLEAVNQLGGDRAFNVMGYSKNAMSSLIEDMRERGEALGWKEDDVIVQSNVTYLASYSKGRRYFQVTLRSGSEERIDFVITTAYQE